MTFARLLSCSAMRCWHVKVESPGKRSQHLTPLLNPGISVQAVQTSKSRGAIPTISNRRACIRCGCARKSSKSRQRGGWVEETSLKLSAAKQLAGDQQRVRTTMQHTLIQLAKFDARLTARMNFTGPLCNRYICIPAGSGSRPFWPRQWC